ncbi:MAG TPA: YbdD/YjiX family protein [Gemmatimonadaceae bacterium]|nr:YbdD/YjiX family protein [Gemmatimonadaceae bacterium]
MIQRIAGLFSRTASIVRAVLGVPDYDRYLAHMRTAHPGDRVMTETEFRHTRMNDKYNRTARCC